MLSALLFLEVDLLLPQEQEVIQNSSKFAQESIDVEHFLGYDQLGNYCFNSPRPAPLPIKESDWWVLIHLESDTWEMKPGKSNHFP